jgi:hypothetical protein
LQLLDCELVEAGNCAQDCHPSEVGGRFGHGYGQRTSALGRQDRAAMLKSIHNSGVYAIYIDSHYAAFPPKRIVRCVLANRHEYVVKVSCFDDFSASLKRARNDPA